LPRRQIAITRALRRHACTHRPADDTPGEAIHLRLGAGASTVRRAHLGATAVAGVPGRMRDDKTIDLARFDLLVIVKACMWVLPTPIGILSTMPTYTPGMEIVTRKK